MTADIALYAQIMVLCLNIITLLFIIYKNKYTFKVARALLLIAVSVGIFINLGQFTLLTLLFSFTPLITLINIKKDGNIIASIKHIWFGSKFIQKLQGNNKANYNKVAQK